MALESETLHIPYHTERERTFLMTFRALCRLKLRHLQISDSLEDFVEFKSVPSMQKDYLELAELVLIQR